jgi:hypothetical protein
MGTFNMLIDNAELDQVGLPTRADGYYGYAGGIHTVAFYLKNFKGSLGVDATLSDNPQESDWFPIGLGNGTEYYSVDGPETKVESFNIVGNFVYLRAKIIRSQLGLQVPQVGTCERVVLSL